MGQKILFHQQNPYVRNNLCIKIIGNRHSFNSLRLFYVLLAVRGFAILVTTQKQRLSGLRSRMGAAQEAFSGGLGE
ncbi:MAG: hypothetical protein LBD13_00055, partial [Spirochaetaceae bacterium]|nr:hypothetical protein [Spirochaetaceae bacterium]